MDLGFLDKSSDVTPLLVRLYDSSKIYGLAKDKKPLARAELTSAVSELLELDVSPRESELIADVLIELMRQAETDLRQAVSERLSVMDNVPLRLALQVANDDIEVATPVLKHSKVLKDLDLIYIIKSQSPAHWQAIASRKILSDQVMNILADTGDFGTATTLAENMDIKLTEHTVTALSCLAQQSEQVARPLLRREEISSDIATKLYQFVGQELKQYILKNYKVESGVLIDAIDDVVLEFSDADSISEFAPTQIMLNAADRFKEKGLLTIKLMLGTLRRGQIQSFVAQFSRFADLDPQTVEEILVQPNGQGLAVACRAFDIMKADFVSIYLLTNRVRAQGKMVDLKDMTKAVNYFNRIKPDVARNIMQGSITKEFNPSQVEID
ncbi:MAG: hypothetical protein DHS20C02_03180 [Micavibrio sp.]|nr:MAG: hypothetical protein DHS20C02_03180 [Micavibrio sp.]